MKSRIFAALVLTAVLMVTACSSTSEGERSAENGNITLTVFAAASLKKSFTELTERFSTDNPDVEVKFNFDGSQVLATQVEQGANVDVLATADEKNMDKLGEQIADPQIFATNVLTIITQPGNPKNIQSLGDLEKFDVSTVVCAVEVPCGSATAKVEESSGVDIKPVSEETAVTGVLTKVQTRQADAGLVYVTDAVGAGDAVTSVSDPAFAAVVNRYPIGVVAATKNRAAAQRFVDMVLGPEGSALLSAQGFGAAN
jgi:molybdate transport system substrate-binding protein